MRGAFIIFVLFCKFFFKFFEFCIEIFYSHWKSTSFSSDTFSYISKPPYFFSKSEACLFPKNLLY